MKDEIWLCPHCHCMTKNVVMNGYLFCAKCRVEIQHPDPDREYDMNRERRKWN